MKALGRRRGFKSWFVEPYRQVKLGIIFLLLNFLFAGLTLGIFGYYVWDIYQTLALYFQLTSDQSSEILLKFQTPIMAGVILMFVFIFLSILVAVRYTHQIYGPLVSIHRFLDEYLQGEPVQPLILRESDQLQELAEKLNQVMYLNPNDRRGSNLRPVYRFLDEWLEGHHPEPISLREGDQFHPLAEKLNQLGKKLAGSKVG